jgi:hypothetical protein
MLAADNIATSSESTHFTSSKASESSRGWVSESSALTHQERAKIIKKSPFEPPHKIGSQPASTDKVLTKDSPSCQAGCIFTHHSIHVAPNSEKFLMGGRTP